MANYTLTAERKAKIKKDVLEEINKSEKKPKPIALASTKKPVLKVKKINSSTKKPQLSKPIPSKKVINVNITKNDLADLKPKIEKPKTKTKIIKKTTKVKKSSSAKALKTKTQLTKVKPKVKKINTSSAVKIITDQYKPKVIVKKPPKEKQIIDTSSVKEFKQPTRPSKKEMNFDLKSPDSKVISSPKKPQGSKLMFILGSVVFLILAIITILSINIWGIYKLDWNNNISYFIADSINLPAGSVNGEKISLKKYFDDIQVIKLISISSESADDSQYRDEAFNRLTSLTIINQELKKYGQSVSSELLDEETNNVLADFDSLEDAKEEIQSKYGMNIESFKERVLKPILSIELLKSIASEDANLPINKEIESLATQALQIALTGGDKVDFNELSLQFTNDEAISSVKGDMGWFVKGDLPSSIEAELFNLESGEIYNQIVKDALGYHIFKIDAKIANEETGQESIKLSQILIKPDTELYFKSLFDNANIKNYLK